MHVSLLRSAGLTALAVVVLILFAPAAPSFDPAGRSGDTVEPLPGLSIDVRVDGLQRLARGGVASLVVEVTARVAVDDAAVTITLPDEVTFTDGSRRRSWRPDLAAGRALGVPVDLLAGRDGVFPVRIEATATCRGVVIRRGLTHDLRLGVNQSPPPRRNGAVEFRGVSTASGRRP